MKTAKDITVCVADHGLFLHLALALRGQVARVLYWTPHEDAFEHIKDAVVGDGWPGVERIRDLWSHKDDIDLFVFPDIGMGGLQRELASQGKAVWGHMGADELELNRGFFLGVLHELNLPSPKSVRVRGLTALRSELEGRTDAYVKLSRYRGIIETFHWSGGASGKYALDKLACDLGPAKELPTFYVCDPVEAIVEDGIDAWCINGRLPSTVVHGVELKDRAFALSVQNTADIDWRIRVPIERFAAYLGQYGYRGFFAGEVRVTKDAGYMIDPCCRASSPCSQLSFGMVSNLAQVLWLGAHGEMVPPKYSAPHGVQVVITAERENCDWVVLDIPEELDGSAMFGFSSYINGSTCIPPNDLGGLIGWLVSTGETIEDAVDSIKQKAKLLPDNCHCDTEILSGLLREEKDASGAGIDFADPIPEPSSAV